MTIKEHLQAVLGRDLRAALADVYGYTLFSPDQEQHIEALQTQPRVAAKGGTGTGKSRHQGAAAALVLATSKPSKALFGAPKQDQAAKLSWLEMQNALAAALERGLNLAGPVGCGVMDWYPLSKERRPDWFAACMALSDRNNAAAVKGMMHSERVLIVLDELEGIAPSVRDALDSGTTQEQAHYWFAFNPVDPEDAAGQFWAKTPPSGQVCLSALRFAEWQAKLGITIPGTPSLAAIEAKWKGRENEPRYYTDVLGKFPPESAEWVLIPKDWFDKCVDCLPTGTDAHLPAAFGLDTGGGVAENVLASVQGRVVRLEWCSREQHQTPVLVVRVKDSMRRYPQPGTIAIDYVGLGGKGVGDDLAVEGVTVRPFVGGGREFCGRKDESGLYADTATWAWFSLREVVRLTVQAIDAGRAERYISFPNDPVLREQLARPFNVNADRRYKLAEKSGLKVSPDRGDAVAMAWLSASLRPTVTRIVTAAEMMPELAGIGGELGERW